jgi:hypothetical protein
VRLSCDEGEGNLEAFDTPSLAGSTASTSTARSTIADAPCARSATTSARTRGVREVPPITLATFDPIAARRLSHR